MNYIFDFSRTMSMAICNNAEAYSSPEKRAEIEYGVYTFVSNVIKTIIVFCIAYVLGILNYVLVAFFSFGALRTFAGGVHARTSFGCFFLSAFIYFPAAYLGLYYPLPGTITYILFGICLIMVTLYAPADVAEKPILGKKRRRNLRKWSFITLGVLFALTLFQERDIASIITISCFLESLTLTPPAYALTKSRKGGEYFHEET